MFKILFTVFILEIHLFVFLQNDVKMCSFCVDARNSEWVRGPKWANMCVYVCSCRLVNEDLSSFDIRHVYLNNDDHFDFRTYKIEIEATVNEEYT